MITFTTVKIWHDEDEPTEYRIKVEVINKRSIEILEYPEYATPQLKSMIDDKIEDIMEDLVNTTDDDYDQWENKFGD